MISNLEFLKSLSQRCYPANKSNDHNEKRLFCMFCVILPIFSPSQENGAIHFYIKYGSKYGWYIDRS